ncbi:class D sortase [Bacillus sp. 31A1R]|uniref:Class D sortase n=1 Tax=Robertmurraya mangrovi TaxID=3098077 RepID=A0ABU5J034_9BACI|nr:class D sortase [Bacillus sp. 31A1R]MDZ5472770.1 class D sortase [Bacillus sp. 31A1R]
MNALFSKGISLALIGVGLIVLFWNTALFLEGFYAGENIEINESLEESSTATSSPYSKIQVTKKKLPLYSTAPDVGEKIGDIAIPRLERSLPIIEGTSNAVLRKGVGHFSSSVLPGEKNNCIISGHRDTVFRRLGEIKLHDPLIVTTEAGQFLYKVKRIRIVDADDSTVMSPRPRATLTVTTCYPFYFLGNAPQRYVIVAELVKSTRM